VTGRHRQSQADGRQHIAR